MNTNELKERINLLCDQQIKNLERLTTNPEIPTEEIFTKDAEISAEISSLRRELAKATLRESREKAKRFAEETTADIMSAVNNYVLK